MPLVSGVEKRVVIAKESTWGTKPAANTGREVRRVTAEFNKERASFQSNEITSTAQTSDMRQGTDNITGGLNCELSPNSYTDILASLLRGTWVAGATVKATVLAQGKHDKVTIFKMRRRKHYQKRQGHRQQFTELQIASIQA